MKTNQLLLLLCILFFTCTFALKSSIQPGSPNVKEKRSITFTENKGQICDQFSKTNPEVLFSGTDGNLVFHLKKNSLSYQLSKIDQSNEQSGSFAKNKEGKESDSITTSKKFTFYRIDINWLNANKNPNIQTGPALPDFSNYYLEQCPQGALNVKSYQEILYQNLYSGIDLKWYQKNGQLKYDYLVAAGADYKKIMFEIKGASKISLSPIGELKILTPLGEIIEQSPKVFQNGKLLSSKWIVEGNVVRFEIKNVNSKIALIIDPAVRLWGTYYGGNQLIDPEGVESISTDASGNVYMAGFSTSTVGIATSGAYMTTMTTWDRSFVAKFTSGGVRLWATYCPGGASHYSSDAVSCTTDFTKSVYIAANLSVSNTAVPSVGGHQNSFGGTLDCSIFKFDSMGVKLWSTYYGGTGFDWPRGCATDASGNFYLTGVTNSSSGISTAGAFLSSYTGGSLMGFVVKFNSIGARQWATYYGNQSAGVTISSDIVVDKSFPGIYFCGATSASVGIATSGSITGPFAGAYNTFIVRFDLNGARIWGRYLGDNTNNDSRSYCASDNLGNVYLASTRTGTAAITGATHQQTYGGGATDGHLAKYDLFGTLIWQTYYGGSGDDKVLDCTTNSNNEVFISGYSSTSSGTAIATLGSHQASYGGGSTDAFLAKFYSNGTRQWGTYYGGSGFESWSSSTHGNAPCASDNFGNVYLGGFTSTPSSTTIVTFGAHQVNYGGGQRDGFLVKFYDCIQPLPPTNVTSPLSTTTCPNIPIVLSAAGSGTITWYSSALSPSVIGTGSLFATPLLPSGTYTFYAEDNVCLPSLSRTPITITVMPSPFINVNSGIICNGQSFVLNPSGAVSYTFSSGSATVSPAFTSTFLVTGTNSLGCISSNTAVSVVTVAANPTITASGGTVCPGQNFIITPSGASTYNYPNGSNIVAPMVTTSYSITGNNSGCISSNTAVITVNVWPTPTISVNSGSICPGFNYTLSPSGALTYTFSGGSAIVNPTVSSIFSVTGTSSLGCVSSNAALANVIVYPLPTISASSGTICAGNSFTINPSGAVSYTINTGTTIVTPSATSVYSIIGTNSFGCVSNTPALLTVTVHPRPIVALTSGSICAGSTFTLVPSGSNNYTVTGGSFTVNPLSTTNYSLIGMSNLGCISSNTAVATVSIIASPTISVNSGSICSGSNFTILPAGANTFTISGGASIVSPSITTSYSVTGTSSAGCVGLNSAIATVSVNALPNITASSNNSLNCVGETVTITASGADFYTWSNGGSAFNIIISPTISSTFTLTGTNLSGCNKTIYITQIVSPCTGILDANDPNNEPFFNIYPNPNNGEFYINAYSETDLTIINSIGQVVYSNHLKVGISKIEINELAIGVYFVQLKEGNKLVKFEKVLKAQ